MLLLYFISTIGLFIIIPLLFWWCFMKDPEGPEEVYIGYDDLDQEYKDLVERAIKNGKEKWIS
nr:MAG TPA: protein of unknown function (DUF1970) [Caudoviricetes sp.]